MLLRSARRAGIDEVRAYPPLSVDPGFAAAHRAILTQKIGAGYWLWKPYIIGAALAQAQPGDWVIYADAGACFTRGLAPLLSTVAAADALFFENDTLNRTYVKRDCFVLTGTDTPDYHAARQLDAALICLRKTPAAGAFVDRWLALCTDARMLTDSPNQCGLPDLPGFRAHRHDQAVLSLLARREAACVQARVLPRDAKFAYLMHHRRRVGWLPLALWHWTHDGIEQTQRAARWRRRQR